MTAYYPSGSDDLHQAVAALASHCYVILLRQDGVMVGAPDMQTEMGILEEIE